MNLSREFWLQRQQRIEVWADFVDLAIHEFVDRLGCPKLQRLVEDGLSLEVVNRWRHRKLMK